MTPTKRESTGPGYDKRTSKILRSAASIIRRKGFSATRIDDIAESVGLTKAGLYHYIPKKALLLSAIMEHAIELLDVEVLLPSVAETDPEKRLRHLLQSCAYMFLRERDLMLVLFDEFGQLKPEEQRRFLPRQKEFLELLRTTLEELREEGKLRDLEIQVAVFNLLAPVLWLPRWYKRRRSLSRETVISETVRLGLLSVLENPDLEAFQTS